MRPISILLPPPVMTATRPLTLKRFAASSEDILEDRRERRVGICFFAMKETSTLPVFAVLERDCGVETIFVDGMMSVFETGA